MYYLITYNNIDKPNDIILSEITRTLKEIAYNHTLMWKLKELKLWEQRVE